MLNIVVGMGKKGSCAVQRTVETPRVQLFGQVVDAPVVVQRQVRGAAVQKTVEIPQFDGGSSNSFVDKVL